MRENKQITPVFVEKAPKGATHVGQVNSPGQVIDDCLASTYDAGIAMIEADLLDEANKQFNPDGETQLYVIKPTITTGPVLGVGSEYGSVATDVYKI